MSIIQNEKPVKNREALGEDYQAPVVDHNQIKLARELNDLEAGSKLAEVWSTGNSDRTDWLNRQQKYLATWDEFIDNEDLMRGPWTESSNLHLPITLTAVRALHARMFAALFSVQPPFSVRPQNEAATIAIPLIEGVMQYAIKEWINEYDGISETMDQWLWEWVTTGTGILKLRWSRTFSRYVEVKEETVVENVFSEEAGRIIQVPKQVAKEEPVTKKIFDGPAADLISPEDLLIVGGNGDVNRADTVIHRYYHTRSEMYALADQKIFDPDVVTEVLEGGNDSEYVDTASGLKLDKSQNSGIIQENTNADTDRFEILECYCKMDTNGDGLDEDVIVWVHSRSKKVLRATYLYRVFGEGFRPFAKIDFLKKRGHPYGIGVPEILYSLQKEVDAIHNLKVDYGTLATMPFGFYRAAAGMKAETLELEPGKLIPLNDPQTDVFFPNLGNRTAFAEQQEGTLLNYVERLISISDINLGVIGGQGATRTATGVNALVSENNVNLDIFIKRAQRGWRQFLRVMLQVLQRRMPKEMWIRITGEDGGMHPFLLQRGDIQGRFDFDIDATSVNSNKAVTREIAQQVLNLAMNPMLIQMGIVTPDNLYNACKNWVTSLDVKDFARYLTKPSDLDVFLTPMQEVARLQQGIPVPIHPAMNHQAFITYVNNMVTVPEYLGLLTEEQTIRIAQQYDQHIAMQQAIQQQEAQMRNIAQQQINAAQAGAGQVSAGPASPSSGRG